MDPPPKRVVRTYGRPKDPVPQDVDSSFSRGAMSSSPHHNILRTGPPHLNEEIPQSSQPSRLPSDPGLADDLVDAEDASNLFQFYWKAELKAIDEDAGIEIATPAAHGGKNASHVQDTTSVPLTSERVDTAPNSPNAEKGALSQDIFGGSLPSLTDSSFNLSPPPPVRRIKHRRLVPDSDEDTEHDIMPFSSPISPPVPHPITTPMSLASVTPPTSDEESLAIISPERKSRGRAKSPTDIPAMPNFGDGIAAEDNKAPLKFKRASKLKSKVKPPTKKELKATARDRMRIGEDQIIAIARPMQGTKHTLLGFFETVRGNSSSAAPVAPSSDHDSIAQFSSPNENIDSHSHSPSPSRQRSPTPSPKFPSVETPVPDEAMPGLHSDDDLPPVGTLLDEATAKKTQDDNQRALMERKKLLLQSQFRQHYDSDGDDDDLEIVESKGDEMQVTVKTEAEHRRLGANTKPSEGRKRQLIHGGIGIGQQKQSTAPSGLLSVLGSKSGRTEMKELNESLIKAFQVSAAEETRRKEEEWVRRGGKLNNGQAVTNSGVGVYLEKGMQNVGREDQRMLDDESDNDDASDEDYVDAMRGSASPVSRAHIGDSDGEHHDSEEEDVTMVDRDDGDKADDETDENDENNDENDENVVSRPRAPRRSRNLVESDSEDDENVRRLSTPDPYDENDFENMSLSPTQLPAGHRGTSSSMDERTEDEGDKENATHLMYDGGEDKENKAVVRFALAARPTVPRLGSLHGLEEGIRRKLSMSPGGLGGLGHQGDDEHEEGDSTKGQDQRRPFKDLLPDDDPFASPITTHAPGLKRTSSSFQPEASGSILQPSPSLAPLLGGNKDKKTGSIFSQFSDDQPMGFGGDNLETRFTDLFESETQKEISTSSPTRQGSPKARSIFDRLRNPGNSSLQLTQDVLKPAFEVTGSLKRHADAIFEKEQGYLLEAANRMPEKTEELYVNDYGFLTQTRPEVENPEVYMPPPPAPTQPSSFVATRGLSTRSPTFERRPLGTLSFAESMDLPDSPERQPLRRLTRARTPSLSNESPSPPSPVQERPSVDAFQVLARGAQKVVKTKQKLEKSEFVEDQAQESDDDDMRGFGLKKRDEGDEEDGDHLDRNDETLVDDQEMDENTVAPERVLEKYQEHALEDDQKLQDLHTRAARGDLRTKRRKGVGIDSDEDESEDERHRKIRRGMRKAEIDRDNIKELGENEETRPFYTVYDQDLGDDAAEFEYLQQKQSQDIAMRDDDADDESQGVIARGDLERELREAAQRQEVTEPPLDPHDVSWVDQDDSEEEQVVRVTTRAYKKPGGGHPADPDDGFEIRRRPVEDDRKREKMQSWAKSENRSRNTGTGRSAVGAAVTGHAAKPRAKAGGGSLRSGQTAVAQSRQQDSRKGKAPSVLARVATERSGRFESC